MVPLNGLVNVIKKNSGEQVQRSHDILPNFRAQTSTFCALAVDPRLRGALNCGGCLFAIQWEGATDAAGKVKCIIALGQREIIWMCRGAYSSDPLHRSPPRRTPFLLICRGEVLLTV